MSAPATDRKTRRALVFGIGNALRRDDGVGPAVVGALQQGAEGCPDAEFAVVHQLTPELAEPMATADVVIFVDAALDTRTLRLARVEPGACRAPPPAHHADPAGLVAFTQQQYGCTPEAWVVGIPAHDLGYGEGLSAETRSHVAPAIAAVTRIIQQSCMNSP